MRHAKLIPMPRRRARADKIRTALRRYWASLTAQQRTARANNIAAGRQRQIALSPHPRWQQLAAERDDLPYERTEG